jgi:hypothetical protein
VELCDGNEIREVPASSLELPGGIARRMGGSLAPAADRASAAGALSRRLEVAMPNPDEVATLKVGGRIFEDWETVRFGSDRETAARFSRRPIFED